MKSSLLATITDVGGGGGPVGDTILLMHMDGTDGSTTFATEGTSGQTAAATGNAQIDTAQSVFGGASARFDGNGDVVRVANTMMDWNLTSEFTVEFRVRFNALTTAGLVSNWGGSGDQSFKLSWESADPGLRFTYTTDGNSDVNLFTGDPAWTPTVNTWYSIAITRDASGTLRLFRDGVLQNSQASVPSFFDNDNELWIGAVQGFGGAVSVSLNGWIDEVRITDGCEYTENYAVATEEFTV